MNPIKADKIQFGSTANLPNIHRGTSNELVLYDSAVGDISLSNLLSERSITNVVTVSKTTHGRDFSAIQEAIDFLPQTGGFIVVYEGTYSESLSITKPVALLGRGSVVIESNDAPCLSLTSFDLKCCGLNFVLKDLLGNNNPAIINVSSTDTSKKVSFYDCTFDTTAHPTSSFLSVQSSSLYLHSNLFFGSGLIAVSGASSCEIVSGDLPSISLSNMTQRSYISTAQVLEVTLVDSLLSLSGNANSITGDATSKLIKENVRGQVVFDNELEKVIEFSCPLSSDSYSINIEPNSQRILPVISARTSTGFTLTFQNNLTETIRWSVAQ